MTGTFLIGRQCEYRCVRTGLSRDGAIMDVVFNDGEWHFLIVNRDGEFVNCDVIDMRVKVGSIFR